MRPCFKFAAAASDDQPSTLSIYDEIGFWGVQAKDFVKDLGAISSKTLNVEINSPGGDVFAALAIYNALRASGKEIVVKVMGVAASAASLIAMAGDRIVMPRNTFMMIHNPWSFAVGNADELRETADTLDKIGSSLRATYGARSGLDDEELSEMLAKDTWLTADEALEKGLATEVVDEIKASAAFDLTRAELPENVRAIYLAAPRATDDPEPGPEPATTADPAPTLDPAPAASLVDQIATEVTAAGFEQFLAHISVTADSIESARARIGEIREINALCNVVDKADFAPRAIKAGKTVAQVRTELAAAMVKDDDAAPTSGVRKSEGMRGDASGSAGINPQQVWDSHNANVKKDAK